MTCTGIMYHVSRVTCHVYCIYTVIYTVYILNAMMDLFDSFHMMDLFECDDPDPILIGLFCKRAL